MDELSLQQEGFELIRKSFDLDLGEIPTSRADMVQAIADRVAYWLEYDVEQLFSFLYRMDIDQSKVEHALKLGNVVPANIGVAELIFQRQLDRLKTKKKYKQPDIEDLDEELRY